MRTNKRKRELIEKPTFERNVKTKLTSDISKPSSTMRYCYSKAFSVTDNQPILFKKMNVQSFKVAVSTEPHSNKLLNKLLVLEKKNEKGKKKLCIVLGI